MFFYLLKNTKKGEKVMVYHSLGYYGMIKLLKKLKKINLILEVEEIYADVIGNKKIRDKELEFFKLADAYVFPTELLNDLINKSGKPYVIIHGTYQVEEDRNVSFNDDKIHVVYAGTFDQRKGGVQAAASAKYLTSDYHVHILGFGTKDDTEQIKNVVSESNVEGKGTVTFDGLLSGEEYIKFIQKCQIGLSPQNPDAVFNSTSFPSKVLSYMANGLRVVSIRIPSIEKSSVGGDIYFYEKQTPEEIAKTIISVDLKNGYDCRAKIGELDEGFKNNIKQFLVK
jgi:glycosyltransferase involved in cell wall biosynthesis